MNNENMSSGKGLTLVKTTRLPGQERVTVVASLPTNLSCDVTADIPITHFVILKLLKLPLHTIFMRAILSFQLTFCHYLIYDISSYPNVKHMARLSKIPLKSNVRNRPR